MLLCHCGQAPLLAPREKTSFLLAGFVVVVVVPGFCHGRVPTEFFLIERMAGNQLASNSRLARKAGLGFGLWMARTIRIIRHVRTYV